MKLSFPFIATWSQCLHQHWLIHSEVLYQHPHITDNEKFLWTWLATTSQGANEFTLYCSHSIEHISQALDISDEIIYRRLMRLKLMGFLRSTLPITFEKLTAEMITQERKIVLCMPSKVFLTTKEALRVMNEDRQSIPIHTSI